MIALYKHAPKYAYTIRLCVYICLKYNYTSLTIYFIALYELGQFLFFAAICIIATCNYVYNLESAQCVLSQFNIFYLRLRFFSININIYVSILLYNTILENYYISYCII